MLTIEIDLAYWNLRGNSLNNRESFNEFIKKFIGSKLNNFSECQQTLLILPSETTKQDRYMIHRMSIKNHFIPRSYDIVDVRFMEITFSKKYIEDILNDFIFPEPIPVPVPKSEKQILFESVIKFIENNLLVEFQEYMDQF